MKQIISRIAAPTPPFFKKVRLVGLILTAVAGTIAAAPIVLPTIVTQIAGYLALAGAVASTVSQMAVQDGSSATNDKEEES